MASGDAQVFVCYSHQDREWKDHVVKFLNVLKSAKRLQFEAWDDSRIELGGQWEDDIAAALARARVALLLISADFLQSDFILKREVPTLRKRAKQGELRIIPILVRPCPWEYFDWLRSLQGLMEEETTLSGRSDHEIEQTLTELVRKVDHYLEQFRIEAAGAEEVAPKRAVAAEEEAAAGYELPNRTAAGRDSRGFLTNAGVTDLIRNSPRNPGLGAVTGLVCILQTRRQHTWLAVTGSRLFCLLDDEKTRAARREIQWSIPLAEAAPVSVRSRSGKNTGLVNVGPKRNWLYSQKRHPNPKALKSGIEKMIEAGRKG